MATTQDGTLLNSEYLDRPTRSEGTAQFERRIAALQQAARDSRRDWRRAWGNFYLIRHANSIRMPSWRVEQETKAWARSRDEVRRYASLRGQITELRADLESYSPLLPVFRTGPLTQAAE